MKLIPFADIDRNQTVFQLRLFEKQRDFVTVGRWCVVEVDHFQRPLSDEPGHDKYRACWRA
ncbi:hypothetical protein D3C81_1385810 [compost metagenome]